MDEHKVYLSQENSGKLYLLSDSYSFNSVWWISWCFSVNVIRMKAHSHSHTLIVCDCLLISICWGKTNQNHNITSKTLAARFSIVSHATHKYLYGWLFLTVTISILCVPMPFNSTICDVSISNSDGNFCCVPPCAHCSLTRYFAVCWMFRNDSSSSSNFSSSSSCVGKTVKQRFLTSEFSSCVQSVARKAYFAYTYFFYVFLYIFYTNTLLILYIHSIYTYATTKWKHIK